MIASIAVSVTLISPASYASAQDSTPTAAPASEQGDFPAVPKTIRESAADTESLPDAQVAVQRAEKTGDRVEIKSERTVYNTSYANPDGTGTMEISGAPVRAKDDEGAWAPVNYDLVEKSDGYFYPTMSPTEVRVSGGGTREAGRVTLSDGSVIATSWRDILPTPTIEGSTARYELSATTDLLVTAIPAGFTTRFELSAPPAESLDIFKLGFTTQKLVLDEVGGQIIATNLEGDEIGGTPTLTAWDAEMDYAGDPIPVELDAELSISSRSGDLTDHELLLTAPAGWLDDPDTLYPVTIDPDVVTRNPTRDTFVKQNSTTVNGASHGLVIGSDDGTTYSLAYLRFNIDGLAEKEIISADMNLYEYYGATCLGRQMDVRGLSDSFTNATTWANRPGITSGLYASKSFNHANEAGCGRDFEAIPIKPLLDEWIGSGNFGLRLEGLQSQRYNTSYEKRFCSMDPNTATVCNSATYSPTLRVQYKLAADVGALPWMSFQEFNLSADTTAQVNLKTGNLLVSVNDYTANAPGVSPAINRYYNSLSTRTSRSLGNWTLGTAGDVGIEVVTNPVGTSKYLKLMGPNGFIGKFNYDEDNNKYISPPGLHVEIEPIATSSSGAGPFQMTYNSSGERLRFEAADSALGAGGGWLSTDVDRNGIGTTYSYSQSSTLTTLQDVAGREMTFDAGGTGPDRLGRLELEDNRTWQYTITAGRLQAVSNPVGNSPATYEYDSTGRMTALNGSYRVATADVRKRTEFAYDTQGRIGSVKRGSIQGASFVIAATTEFTYGSESTVVKDPRGNDSTYKVDALGRTTSTEDALGRKREKTWTANNDASTLTMGFASAGGAGNTSTMSYDELNNATGVTLPTGAATAAIYAQGANCPNAGTGNPHLAKCTTDSSGNQSEYKYDTSGNLTERKDASSGTTGGAVTQKNTYEQTNRALCDGFKGQICQTKDGNDHTTAYKYDIDGNLTEVNPPGPLGSTISTFDTTGRLTGVTDGNGDTTTYTYDNLDQVLTTTFDNGATATNVWNGDGTLASMTSTNPTWTETYTYNPLGQETHRTMGTAASATMTSQTYDAAGNLNTYTDDGGTVSYIYNAANQLLRVTEPSGSCTTGTTDPAAGSGCIKFEYDSDAQEVKRTFPGGAEQTIDRDKSNRPTRIIARDANGTRQVDIEYSYKLGLVDQMNIITRTSHLEQGIAADAVTTYAYDSRNRLAHATEVDGSTTTAEWEYHYDGAGNRTKQVLHGDSGGLTGTTDYTINSANQIVSTSRDVGTWSYDAAGNQTRNGLRDEAASFGDRGNAVTVSGVGFTSIGQGNSNTVSATDGRQFTNSVLGASRQITGPAQLNYTRNSDGDTISYRDGTAAFYYATDHLGSVVGLFDSAGAWKGGYSYSPYGESRHTGTGAAVVNNTQRYIGGYYEGNGVYKLGARYYDTQLGRFTQMDPSGQDANPYAYGGGNPVGASDPNGLAAVLKGLDFFLDLLGLTSLLSGNGTWFGFVASVVFEAACIALAASVGLITGGAGFGIIILCAVVGEIAGSVSDQSFKTFNS